MPHMQADRVPQRRRRARVPALEQRGPPRALTCLYSPLAANASTSLLCAASGSNLAPREPPARLAPALPPVVLPAGGDNSSDRLAWLPFQAHLLLIGSLLLFVFLFLLLQPCLSDKPRIVLLLWRKMRL